MKFCVYKFFGGSEHDFDAEIHKKINKEILRLRNINPKLDGT